MFFYHRLTSCSMNCQRRMTCFVLFRSLLRRAKQIPAVPLHFVSMSLSMCHMICCNWMSCKINSESWKRRTLLCDRRYIRLKVYTIYAEYEINQDILKLHHLGFSWSFMIVLCNCPTSFGFLCYLLSLESSSSPLSMPLGCMKEDGNICKYLEKCLDPLDSQTFAVCFDKNLTALTG